VAHIGHADFKAHAWVFFGTELTLSILKRQTG
jgi:hypothetical protein